MPGGRRNFSHSGCESPHEVLQKLPEVYDPLHLRTGSKYLLQGMQVEVVGKDLHKAGQKARLSSWILAAKAELQDLGHNDILVHLSGEVGKSRYMLQMRTKKKLQCMSAPVQTPHL
mmetsp:Transcript_22971/g.50769  ORF Transcript_22971/g.50769 Transcript_22971/m.50769 type:complete len:116 (+) Transcript_22971:62-409(+)